MPQPLSARTASSRDDPDPNPAPATIMLNPSLTRGTNSGRTYWNACPPRSSSSVPGMNSAGMMASVSILSSNTCALPEIIGGSLDSLPFLHVAHAPFSQAFDAPFAQDSASHVHASPHPAAPFSTAAPSILSVCGLNSCGCGSMIWMGAWGDVFHSASMSSYLARSILSRNLRGFAMVMPRLLAATVAADARLAIEPSHAVPKVAILRRQPHLALAGAVRGDSEAVRAPGGANFKACALVDVDQAELAQLCHNWDASRRDLALSARYRLEAFCKRHLKDKSSENEVLLARRARANEASVKLLACNRVDGDHIIGRRKKGDEGINLLQFDLVRFGVLGIWVGAKVKCLASVLARAAGNVRSRYLPMYSALI
eukprot:Opistho-2@50938